MDTTSSGYTKAFIEAALALLLLLVILFSLYSVLSVFFGVFTYAIILSVSLFNLFEKFVRLLGNKRNLAAFIYAILMLAIIAAPFIYLISLLGNYVNDVEKWISDIKNHTIPDLPAWVTRWPVYGSKISAFWTKLQTDPEGTMSVYEPQIKAVLSRLLSGGVGIVGASLEFIFGVIISAVFLARGVKMLDPIYATMRKISGEESGPELVNAAGKAVKGVAVGVMGTAFIEALLAWIGFAIAGISFAPGLAAIIFFLALVQIGPLFGWLPVAIWLFTQGETGWGIFITIYGIVALMGVDNVLKPILIAKSGKLPILVLFLGVIGGMAAWGFTGMFKGAIVLAVFYTIMRSWLGQKDPDAKGVNPVSA